MLSIQQSRPTGNGRCRQGQGLVFSEANRGVHRQDIDDLDTGRLRGVPLTRAPGARLALDARGALAVPPATPAAPVANLKQA